jgi:type I restriction enzyme M protein
MENHFTEKANFLWNIANIIRDAFKRGRYQDVILPFTVLRRIDSVLEPTKDQVMETYYEYRDKLDHLDPLLKKKSGYAFYNISRFTFERLLADPDSLAENLINYIAGFSANMRDVLSNFDFPRTIQRLDEAGLLYLVMERFHQIDLHPDTVPNYEMGTIFEELIRRFNEALNENPGEHFTPRDVVRLMSRLLIQPDREILQQPHLIRKFYDPCCGTGGMLTIAKDYVHSFNPDANIYLYGQEVNPETYAVCKSDLYMKDPTGKDAENIERGSTLSDDQHPGEQFAYQLANPPYGKNWRGDSKAVNREAERGYAGRFGAGTPRISDGQLLFLQHMISHMQSSDEGGGRIAIIMNGSPLFTGDAGSGESEIRRWVLENDWLEALVALPEQLFYNTGIATYVWILSNRKPEERRDQVRLIDATDLWAPMRKSLGNKRRQMEEEHIQEIVALYQGAVENGRVKVFDTAEFGFRKIRVERPLRMNFQASPERIEELKEERAFQKIAKSRKRDPEKKQREIEAGKQKQRAILAMLHEMDPKVYKDVESFREVFKSKAEERGIQLYAATRDAIVDALGQRDETAAIMVDRQGRPEPDTDLRDYENVPLDEDVQAYFEREVKPYVPDAWIDEDYTDEKDGGIGRVGYEVNFNRYFYEYEPPRPLEEIEADIKVLQEEIVEMLEEVTQA